MLLHFGSIRIDTKSMPAVSTISVHPPVGEGRPVLVYLALVSDKRAAVEKWAARLGAPVTEQLRPLYEGDAKPLDISAVAEADGARVEVYTRAAAPDLAGLPWQVWAQPEGGARWLVNAFTTRERAERFTERHPTEYGPLTIECAAAADPAPLHWPSRGLRTTTRCQGEPLTAADFAASEADVTCPACRALLADETAEASGGAS